MRSKYRDQKYTPICLILNVRTSCDAGDDRFYHRNEILVEEHVNSRPEAMGENDLWYNAPGES